MVVDCVDVRMVQRGCRACLVPEPFERLGIDRAFREKLQGDRALKLQVLDEVDDAVPPAPNKSCTR